MPTGRFTNTTGRWTTGRKAPAERDELAKGPLAKINSLEIVHPPLQTASAQARQAEVPEALLETQAVTEAGDPRWVLAVRVAEALQGSLLPAEKRDRLIRVGKMLGLTAFDANLIVAMVQDQARRGHRSTDCAHAVREQLTMIPLPERAAMQNKSGRMQWRHIMAVTAATIVAELFVVWWVLGWLRQG